MPILRSLASLRNLFLDRCVLRPTRQAIDPGDLRRCELSLAPSATGPARTIECYVATDLATKMATDPAANELPQESPLQGATTLADWDDAPAPKTLLIKFPGTAGRAERSSPFPLNLVADQDGQTDPSRAESPGNPAGHYEAWTWNPPGYGQSTGRASLVDLVPAAEAFATAVVRSRCGPDTQIWLCGNSLGCLSALSLAARPADWLPPESTADRCVLWLRNPPDLANTILRVADRYASRPWMRRLVAHLPADLSSIDNAAHCHLPAVFLMSEFDELVPPSIQQKIHDAYAGEHSVVTLTDLGHGGLIEEQHYPDIQAALSWLMEAATSH
ncbi:alpha/beta hydrolase [Allorhodopirellula solitaria]|nr:alpha/beta hydrolase [Allorhodopirellula solitaria]